MKTTTTTTNTATAKTNTATDNRNTFANLITAYNTNPTDLDTLTNLAKAVTFSVLKKCIDVSQNQTLIKMRSSILTDLANIDRIAYATENATETYYTADGDKETRVKDTNLLIVLHKLICTPFGDGLDLVNDAIVAILDETQKQTQRDPDQPTDLERPYTVRRLNKKVWIKTADTVNGWETVETRPIQEIYKAVRRSIDNSRAVQTDPRNGYTYIADLVTDPDTDTAETVYRRLPKYADLGGYATDFNGQETFYTADPETVKDLDTIVESMNLTTKQAKVLQLRQSGYGYKAIATYLGVTQRAVAKTVKAIQDKAVAVGLTPTK